MLSDGLSISKFEKLEIYNFRVQNVMQNSYLRVLVSWIFKRAKTMCLQANIWFFKEISLNKLFFSKFKVENFFHNIFFNIEWGVWGGIPREVSGFICPSMYGKSGVNPVTWGILLGDVKNPGKLCVSINPDTWKGRKTAVNPVGCVPFVGRAPLPGGAAAALAVRPPG